MRAILAAENLGHVILTAEIPCARYFDCRKPWARHFGCGKILGVLFGLRRNPGRAIWAAEKPWGANSGAEKAPAERGTRTPWFWGGRVSNPVPPGCDVHMPTHWAIVAPFRWRVPGEGASFPTLEPIGVYLFRHGNLRFLRHNGALGAKMGGNESYGRCTFF